MSGPVKVDVLVVGSGAAGLSAAVTAAMHGASVMVAEKASVLGGTSAWSGGWLWIPRNPLARAEGIDEAADAPLTYLQHEMGGEAADIRLQTFLRYGPEMVEFFHQRTAVQFLSGSAMPDFHPSPGAANGGRSVTAQPYDGHARRLAPSCVRRWKPLAWAGWASPAARIWRIFSMPPARRAPRCMLPAMLRHGWQRLRAGRGQHLVNGNALVARLLRSALDAGVRFQLNAPVVRLLQGPPGVSGAVLRSDGGEIHVEAGAVVLAWRRFSPRSPAAGAGGAPRGGGLRPFLRRTAGQSGRGDQAWRIRRRPVRHFPAPPAGLGAGVPRHSGQRPAANVSSSGGARQTRGDRRPAQRQTFC